MVIPSLVLKQLYTFGSLENVEQGVEFSVKNRLSDASLTGLQHVRLDGREIPLKDVSLTFDDGIALEIDKIKRDPVPFPLRRVLIVRCAVEPLALGKHKVEIHFATRPFGKLKLKVEDSISEKIDREAYIPRDPRDDCSPEIISARQKFVQEITGEMLEHVAQYSFDPHIVAGNIENFTGAAQIPIGVAGPLLINGEYAQSEYLIPLATTEGTLVASYNRGMKVLNLSGGATCSVVGDAMQRAPVFVFGNAREARDFVKWVDDNSDKIREEAEATSRIAKLSYIDPFLASKFAYLRFNFTTGDAAGQNMVGRATFAACS